MYTDIKLSLLLLLLLLIMLLWLLLMGVRSTEDDWPVSNSLQLLFQSESQFEVVAMNISFHSHQ